MKRIVIGASLAFTVLLAGCLPQVERAEEEVIVVEETEIEEEQEFIVTPSIDTPDSYYRNMLSGDGEYFRSQARGVVADAMQNRVDLDQFELGLMEIASNRFGQDEFYFREGSYISGEVINSWLRRYDPDNENNVNGLNPQLAGGESMEDQMRNAPLMISHIMEHNYFSGNEEDGVNLGGVVIGIGVRSVYYFQTETEDGRLNFFEQAIDSAEAEEYARNAAGIMLERLRQREGLEEVPITFALYREEPRGSIIPGSFISLAEVGQGQNEISGWDAINEDNLIFPSGAAREAQPALSDSFTVFRDEIETFFGRTVGVVGKGRYQNDTLSELQIELNLQSHGKAEIIALTQFIRGRLDSTFQVNAPVNVYVESINGPEALITSMPDQEPFVHVYGN
ncbi:CamS family sex pheromone protein [Paenalkalicoccus suaedae]|uniref:CamS family sex pheromone protein n=1 Tax=Paenalkalicoccus suaedae TaxID=2592382 RepID=A0A859FCE2_9BACI|nr:CamS family sex pheromone protein [Paenalkalicoccus suaedae]QKS70441.1 CamS family sex pheromone protein [Paenalkalicoccus suaedae]